MDNIVAYYVAWRTLNNILHQLPALEGAELDSILDAFRTLSSSELEALEALITSKDEQDIDLYCSAQRHCDSCASETFCGMYVDLPEDERQTYHYMLAVQILKDVYGKTKK